MHTRNPVTTFLTLKMPLSFLLYLNARICCLCSAFYSSSTVIERMYKLIYVVLDLSRGTSLFPRAVESFLTFFSRPLLRLQDYTAAHVNWLEASTSSRFLPILFCLRGGQHLPKTKVTKICVSCPIYTKLKFLAISRMKKRTPACISWLQPMRTP